MAGNHGTKNYTLTKTYSITWVGYDATGSPYTTLVSGYPLAVSATPGSYRTSVTQTDPYNNTVVTTFPIAFRLDPTGIIIESSPSVATTIASANTGTTSTSGSAASSSKKTSANSSSSTSPATATGTGTSKSHVTPGAAAGIGIGCAAAGAIIAAILVCLLMRRKGSRQTARPTRGSSMRDSMREKGPSGGPVRSDTMIPLTKTSTQSNLDASLPQPIQDSDISGSMTRLGNAIKNHAQSYYGASTSSSVSVDQLSSLLGTSSPLSAKALGSLLSNASSQIAVIRFLLGWSILNNAQCSSPPERTLLPPELSECMESMKAYQSNGDVRSMLLSKWRHLSACLMQSTFGGDSISPNDPRQTNIHALVEALDAALAPLASGRSNSERRSGLEAIVRRGASFGYTLFTQPTDWNFDWEHPDVRQQGEIVVFPSLLQTGDEHGRKRTDSQPHTEAQSVSVGSIRY